jgi:uncharacterized protein YvpB
MKSKYFATICLVIIIAFVSGCAQKQPEREVIHEEEPAPEFIQEAEPEAEPEIAPEELAEEPAVLPKQVNLDVPFTSQAPHANWDMPYQEACEEASIIMVKHYLSGEPITPDHADGEILEMVNWQTANGYNVDIDAKQTMEVGMRFYDIKGDIFYDGDVTIESIKKLIAKGHPVIIPAAGRMLGNPNFTGLGPPYHMLVIKGYNDTHFITNDPGTRRGEGYEYTFATIDRAIHDWTGSKETIREGRRAMLILYE